MEFYRTCLGGELMVTKVGDTPLRDHVPAAHHHKVAYARLKSGSMEFSATDRLHSKRTPKQGNTVAMYVDGGTYTELRTVFDKLAAGADTESLDELRDMPFGSYGHLADQYGVHWFFRGEKRQPH